MSWTNRYVGIPYVEFGRRRTGCDCWGLACLIYREELGINLPEYTGAYSSADEHAEISALIEGGVQSPLWRAVSDQPSAFDIALFRRGRLSTHVGIVVRDGLMIHMRDEDCAKIETYESGPWKHRSSGFYRHVQRRSL